MAGRIEGGISPRLDPRADSPSSAAGQAADVPRVGDQMVHALFGRQQPPVLDPDSHPILAALIRMLNRYRKKLAVMAGDDSDDYVVVLADGTLAMIDELGTIYFGAGFLMQCKDVPEILVGALAHEIGHRPKRWVEYRVRKKLTPDEIHALCRHEETRADIFAGKGLAELGMECEPLCQFLLRFGQNPHPDYHPAEVRAAVIRDAYSSRAYRVQNRRKLFPEFDKAFSPKNDLGEY
ncbi:MAG: hypothetical protein AAFQ65_02575 [Myxococcota bacterium]